MNWLRVALLVLYCAAPLLQAPVAVPRGHGSFEASVSPFAEMRAPSAPSAGFQHLVEGTLALADVRVHSDGLRLVDVLLPGRTSPFRGISRSSPYTCQSVPCELIPFGERLPYDANAPPASL